MIATDLVGEPAVRASLLAMREEMADLRRSIEEGAERAKEIPHRTNTSSSATAWRATCSTRTTAGSKRSNRTWLRDVSTTF